MLAGAQVCCKNTHFLPNWEFTGGKENQMKLCVCTDRVSAQHHVDEKRQNKVFSSNEIRVLDDQFCVSPLPVQVLGCT